MSTLLHRISPLFPFSFFKWLLRVEKSWRRHNWRPPPQMEVPSLQTRRARRSFVGNFFLSGQRRAFSQMETNFPPSGTSLFPSCHQFPFPGQYGNDLPRYERNTPFFLSTRCQSYKRGAFFPRQQTCFASSFSLSSVPTIPFYFQNRQLPPFPLDK